MSATSDGARVLALEATIEELKRNKSRLEEEMDGAHKAKSDVQLELDEARLSSPSLQG
jgi:predicted  nucleic acid-binding Zn-ribbon protein